MAEFSDPHQWYFVVRCEECRQFISLGEAPPIDAEAEPRFEELHVICPHCDADRGYRPVQVTRQLQRVRAPAGGPNARPGMARTNQAHPSPVISPSSHARPFDVRRTRGGGRGKCDDEHNQKLVERFLPASVDDPRATLSPQPSHAPPGPAFPRRGLSYLRRQSDQTFVASALECLAEYDV
jgi:hypothetical protein